MKTTTVRIPDDVQEALTLSAERNYRSIHGEILEWLRNSALFHANITEGEKDRLFYGKPNYKQLAEELKEELKEKEELISTLGRVVSKHKETIEGFDPEYFKRRFAKDREEAEELATISS
jgi:hypothetical protein